MVGANPKFRTYDRAGRDSVGRGAARTGASASASRRFSALALARPPVGARPALLRSAAMRPGAERRDACGQCAGLEGRHFRRSLPEAAIQGPLSDRERKPGAAASPPTPAAPAHGADGTRPLPGRVAGAAGSLPASAAREDQTMLVSLKSSAFPYLGNNPRTDQPFLNISNGERRGHRSYSGRVLWQDETFNDNRVLMHVPENFDIRKPGVIVVFFHGNGATLERDVRDRQLVPQQISDSGVNAVLLAPQLAVDAADSSAGKFWQPGGLKRFVDGISRPPRRAVRRSARRQGVRQHAGHHRRLQRRLRADRLEPGSRRPRQSRARRVPARRGLWRTGQVRVLDREKPIRLLRQFLHPLHRASRPRTDAHAERQGHRRIGETWTGR